MNIYEDIYKRTIRAALLLDLAQHRDKGFVPLKDIAERQNVREISGTIVPILNKSDMLQTNRGFQGGLPPGERAGSVHGGG